MTTIVEAVPESHRDLLEIPVAVLATIGRDEYPQVTATWFLLDEDGVLRLSLAGARQKLKNLRGHPECTLFLMDPASPYRTLEIRARAELAPDPDYAFADKLGRKYGADLRSTDPPGQRRFAVSLEPVKINVYPTG
jgi:PPOX class probable F420-dependent enzyme